MQSVVNFRKCPPGGLLGVIKNRVQDNVWVFSGG